MVQIMLLGQQHLWLCGLIQMIKSHPRLTVMGQGGFESIGARIARGEYPQLLIIDLTCEVGRGLGMIDRLRKTLPEISIAGLVKPSSQPILQRLIDIGVKGLITPSTDEEEFINLLLRIARQEHAITAALAQALAAQQLPGQVSDFQSLTTREMEVALSLIEGKRMPAIARQLKVSPKTVATYKYRIYDKLNVDTEVALLKLAIRFGLIDLETEVSQPSLFRSLA